MSKIVAIDYGRKRVGLAATDDMQLIASGLATIHSSEVIAFLEDFLRHNDVETIVVGEPKNLDNSPSEFAEGTDNFVKNLKRKFKDVQILRMDERFTSKMAFQTMIDSGLSKKARRNKDLIDEISAVIILQSYLSSIENNRK